MIASQLIHGIRVRERRKRKPSIVAFDEDSMRKWIETLPMANVVEAARQVFRVLGEFNETEVSPNDRFACLNVLEKVINPLRATLKKQYLGKALSLTDNQINVMHFAEALDQELAVGYKTVLETAANRFFKSKSLLAGANYRAMSVLSKILIRRYQLYTSPPGTVWREIHALFSHSVDNKYLNVGVSNSNDSVHDIESLYLKIILLFLTNPCQLRQVDAEYIYSQFDNLVAAICLEETNEIEQEYYVDLLSDCPPMFCFSNETPLGAAAELQRTLIIDVEPLCDHLKVQLRNAPKENTKITRNKTGELDPIILKHLISALAKPSPRSFSRTEGKGSLPIAIGIASTHAVLIEHLRSQQIQDEEELIEQVEQSYQEIKSAPSQNTSSLSITKDGIHPNDLVDESNKFNVEKEDAWTKANKVNNPKKEDQNTHLPNPLNPVNTLTKTVLTEASIVDLSPGGFCLALDVEIPPQLTVEEIIGIKNIQNTVPDWSIGIVRWIKSRNARSFTIGIQSLSPKGIPINSQVVDTKGKASSFQRTLFIPIIPGVNHTNTLLTPPIPYRVGERVRFTDGIVEHTVKLTKLINSSHCFKQFEFLPIEDKQNKTVEKPQREKVTKDDDNDLDDLPKWDIL